MCKRIINTIITIFVISLFSLGLIASLGFETAFAENDPVSGTWGTCTWDIDENGIFTIHPGTGSNTNFVWPVFEGLDYEAVKQVIVRTEGGKAIIAPSDCSGLFMKFTNATSFDLSGLDTTNTKIMTSMFEECSSLESIDISSFDLSNAERLNGLFYKCSSLTSVNFPELSGPNIETIMGMFARCTALRTIELTGLNAPNLTDVSTIFSGCTSLENADLSGWNIPNAKNAVSTFENCKSLVNLKIEGWNAPKLDLLNCIFQSCESLTELDFSSWEEIKPTRMYSAFKGCASLTSLDISNLDASTITDASFCFSGCSSLSVVSISGKYGPKMDLPNNTINGHSDWFSDTDGKWFTSEEIRKNRTTIADTYRKKHMYGEWMIVEEATCIEDGSREKVCETCGDTVTETIPASGHSYGAWEITKEATCQEAGSKKKVCVACGDTITEEIPVKNHTWGESYTVDKEPTCTEKGSKSHHCTECGEIEPGSSVDIDMTDHEYGEWEITKDVTCTEDGSRKKVCKNCGDTITETIVHEGHKYSTEYSIDKEPTCKEEGSRSIHCSVCGAIKEGSSEMITKTTAHTFGDWTIIKQPTTTVKGVKERTCSVCGFTEKQEIEKLPVTEALSIKSLWASEHSVGKVKFKWTKKDGITVTGWNLKYRTRKIGAGGSWSDWTTKSYPASTYEAWINIPVDYVIEIHAQAKGDKTWSTGIITTPAGGKYQAMKTTYVLNTAIRKRVGTSLTMKVGETIKVRPDYEYPVKDYNKRPKLYPNQMLYDVSDKTIISITKPDGSKYTGGMIDGVATIKATKKGTTQIVFRAPNGRTHVTKITVK